MCRYGFVEYCRTLWRVVEMHTLVLITRKLAVLKPSGESLCLPVIYCSKLKVKKYIYIYKQVN